MTGAQSPGYCPDWQVVVDGVEVAESPFLLAVYPRSCNDGFRPTPSGEEGGRGTGSLGPASPFKRSAFGVFTQVTAAAPDRASTSI